MTKKVVLLTMILLDMPIHDELGVLHSLILKPSLKKPETMKSSNILYSSIVTSCMTLCYLLVESSLMLDISIVTPVLMFKDTGDEMKNKETKESTS